MCAATRSLSLSITAVAAASALTGCMASMGDLQKGADDVGKSARDAMTSNGSAEIAAYKLFIIRNLDTMTGVLNAGKGSGFKVSQQLTEFGTVKYRYTDVVGRVFEPAIDVIKSTRFPVPQDALDADSKELASVMTGIGARAVEWNRTEPVELVAIAANAEAAGFMVAALKKWAPGLKVSQRVGLEASAGMSGVELRMLNTAPTRVAAK